MRPSAFLAVVLLGACAHRAPSADLPSCASPALAAVVDEAKSDVELRLAAVGRPVPPTGMFGRPLTGVVVVQFIADARGRVVCTDAPPGTDVRLATAAREAVVRSVFQPARADGVAVPAHGKMTINFGEG